MDRATLITTIDKKLNTILSWDGSIALSKFIIINLQNTPYTNAYIPHDLSPIVDRPIKSISSLKKLLMLNVYPEFLPFWIHNIIQKNQWQHFYALGTPYTCSPFTISKTSRKISPYVFSIYHTILSGSLINPIFKQFTQILAKQHPFIDAFYKTAHDLFNTKNTHFCCTIPFKSKGLIINTLIDFPSNLTPPIIHPNSELLRFCLTLNHIIGLDLPLSEVTDFSNIKSIGQLYSAHVTDQALADFTTINTHNNTP